LTESDAMAKRVIWQAIQRITIAYRNFFRTALGQLDRWAEDPSFSAIQNTTENTPPPAVQVPVPLPNAWGCAYFFFV